MPARASLNRRERLVALAAVALVQLALAATLIIGLRVGVLRHHERVSHLLDLTLVPPPPPLVAVEPPRVDHRAAAAPKARPAPVGGSPGPKSAAVMAPVPAIAFHPAAAPAGGGTGTGLSLGAGAGGGTGGEGAGYGQGGTDLVQIAGAITPADYPRELRERGIGGRVGMIFTVGASGRVTSCEVTRSSGVPMLDDLTCRLIQQRFRYRPSTDRYGRPISDEVEGEHDWVAR